MAVHKFRTGQTVQLVPGHYGAARRGGFRVVRLLPEEHGTKQYRIKSIMDGHERVVTEEELT